MGEKMEATNRLRWSYRRQNMDTGWPVLLPVLQQLWQETASWWDDDMKMRHTEVIAEEWRDVPVEEETQP